MANQAIPDGTMSKVKYMAGNATYLLPAQATKKAGDVVARVQRVGSIGWLVGCAASRKAGVTATQSGHLSTVGGGNGHTRLNVLRYGAMAPYCTCATVGRVKVWHLDLDGLDKATRAAPTRPASALVAPKGRAGTKVANKATRTARKRSKDKVTATPPAPAPATTS